MPNSYSVKRRAKQASRAIAQVIDDQRLSFREAAAQYGPSAHDDLRKELEGVEAFEASLRGLDLEGRLSAIREEAARRGVRVWQVAGALRIDPEDLANIAAEKLGRLAYVGEEWKKWVERREVEDEDGDVSVEGGWQDFHSDLIWTSDLPQEFIDDAIPDADDILRERFHRREVDHHPRLLHSLAEVREGFMTGEETPAVKEWCRIHHSKPAQLAEAFQSIYVAMRGRYAFREDCWFEWRDDEWREVRDPVCNAFLNIPHRESIIEKIYVLRDLLTGAFVDE